MTATTTQNRQPNIADYLEFANVQIAAEAFLHDIDRKPDEPLESGFKLTATLLTEGNKRSSKFTPTQADEFIQNWKVVQHIGNTTTGFSGTLFRAERDIPGTGIKEGDLTLSFRSTEFIDDAARDNQATNTLEIKEKGWAFGQIADMGIRCRVSGIGYQKSLI